MNRFILFIFILNQEFTSLNSEWVSVMMNLVYKKLKIGENMKALILQEYNQFDFTDSEKPTIGDDEVLVQVRACGICGSDVHGMDGSSGRRIPPIIMGHEASGIVAEVGKNVSGWLVGDRVTFDSTVYCGECFHCRRGEINLCDNRRVLGVSCGEYRQHGAYAEYVAVPSRILYRLPDNLPFEKAAMVEPVSIAVHAVNITPISLNDTAVVVGAGMIGTLVIQALKIAGCGQIIAVDLEDGKLEKAKELGATAGINAKNDNPVEKVCDLTNGRGAEVSFEVVGNTAAVQTSIECLRKGGSATLVGNLSPTVELPLQSVVTREIQVRGSCASRGEYPQCLQLIADGKIKVDEMISAVAPLQEGSSWFKRLYDHEPGLMKVILKPTE